MFNSDYLKSVDIKCRCLDSIFSIARKRRSNYWSFSVATKISSLLVSEHWPPLLAFQVVRRMVDAWTLLFARVVGRGELYVRLTAYQYPCRPYPNGLSQARLEMLNLKQSTLQH